MLDHTGTRKRQLRDQLLAARRDLGPGELGEHARTVADLLLATPEVRRAATVAAYVSVGSEPGTGPLLHALRESGRHVLLPVLLDDDDLDWAPYAGDGELETGRLRILQPAAPPLGPAAIGRADLVLVPGLAVDDRGTRMGRGGGSYDRALARVPVGTPTWVLLHPGEVLDEVPAEPHDRRVTGVVTPDGVRRF